MTIQELEDLRRDEAFLGTGDISKILGIHQSNVAALAKEGKFQFPHIVSGNRVKFPKDAFLRYMKTGSAGNEEEEQGTPCRIKVQFVGETLQQVAAQMMNFLRECNFANAHGEEAMKL